MIPTSPTGCSTRPATSAAARGGLRQRPDGGALSLELLLSNARSEPAVELIVGDLRALGVECKPEALDPPTFNQRMITDRSEMSVLGIGGINTDEQPDQMRQVYSSTTRAVQHAQSYQNAEFDWLAQQQLTTLDMAERMLIVARMQQIVARDLPCCR